MPPEAVRFGDDGLVSAVIVDATSGSVLMVGYMNAEALDRTRETGLVHFWSRSRQKLWKKGESSEHVQKVQEIRINCDQNSLLFEVEQEGAVCHDGYDTCYYRRLEQDDSLTVVRDRHFDPRDIYGGDDADPGLGALTKRWWNAYEYLADNDLIDESGTSRRLRSTVDRLTPRLADELRELAGVLNGTHRHGELADDVWLESSQVLYWAACVAIWHHHAWDDVRPDRALDVTVEDGDHLSSDTLSRLVLSRAAGVDAMNLASNAAELHDTFALVGTVLRAHAIEPYDVVAADLDELRQKPYFQRT